jgi:hypothetical protein
MDTATIKQPQQAARASGDHAGPVVIHTPATS